MNSNEMDANATLVSQTKLQAYSVVLSVATLLLSVLGGGAGGLALLCSILTTKSIHKLSYALILLLLLASFILSVVWAPQEIVHLLYFHYTHENPSEHFKTGVHGEYILLTTIMAVTIMFVSVENILRQCGHAGKMFLKIWSVSGCVVAVVMSLILSSLYLFMSMTHEGDYVEYFIVFNSQSFRMRAVVLGMFTFLVMVIMAGVVISAIIQKKNGFSNSEDCKNQVPRLLIRDPGNNQSDDESEDTPSMHAASPLPLLAINAATASNHTPPIMPVSPKNKNMLGVNMSQILGRRRHTICQIGDSSTDFVNPAEKAKKYNYIRKFSVDISALQAQLENPKLFSGKAPFQSDTDLHSKPRTNSQKGRLPLETPVLQFDEKEERIDHADVKGEQCLPMLPLITVSDDEGTEKEEIDTKSEHEEDSDGDSEKEKSTLTFKLPVSDTDESHIPENESLHSYDDSNSDLSLNFTKLACLLSASFCLCTLPLFLTEVLRNHLSQIAYINITTCTLALSSIQTIVYPQVILCMDTVVHRALHRLWLKFLLKCRCANPSLDDEIEEHRTHMNTDTSQV